MKQKYEEIFIHVENRINVGFILEFEVQNWKKSNKTERYLQNSEKNFLKTMKDFRQQ
jgi:hypothetical protein